MQEAASITPFDLSAASSPLLFLKRLFVSDFMPHGHCFFWRPEILWLNVASDLLIGASYYSIPFALSYFVHRRKDIAFRPIFYMFAAFILCCGTTHFMDVWTMWHGTYRLDVIIKAGTALISVVTAVILWPLIPKALELPSPTQLRRANEELEKEVAIRKKAVETVQELNRDLERRVELRTAELARSNEELEQFAYVASHDLQQPLRMIANFSELLEMKCKGKMDAQAEDYLQTVLNGAVKMQALINDLLEFSRIGRKEISFSRIDMNELVDGLIKELAPSIQAGKAVVTRDALPVISANPLQITQVMQNLLINALKYSQKNPVIHISSFVKDGEQVFSVRDNGIGIAPVYQEQIFHMFKRLHSEQEYPGSGMGLAICKKIIARYGGKIWVESKPGEGAAFFFSLPLPVKN